MKGRRNLVSMREAIEDERLLGSMMPGDSWKPWRTILIAAMGEELRLDERLIFEGLTGRPREPLVRVDECLGLVGRRGGKTRASAVLAAYVSALVDHRASLVAGERGIVAYMAASVRQAFVAFNYTRGIFESVPLLSKLVANVTVDTIRLSNGIDLEIRPASARTSRGLTLVAAIVDEVCFLRLDDAVDADKAVLDSLRPSLATTNGPLWMLSSPYSRRGEAYATWRRHYGPEGDPRILVLQGGSRVLNPTLPEAVVTRALERDPASARAEYLAEWRDDVSSFLTADLVESATRSSPRALPPQDRLRYTAFIDPSGGGADEYSMAIGHREGERLIVDLVAGRKGNPAAITFEYATILKHYRIGSVRGDRYSAEWSRTEVRRHGIEYRDAPGARSELYLSLSAALAAGRVELPPDPVLTRQLVGLERRTGRNGKDVIDHAPHSHDDRANSVAGCIASMLAERDEPQTIGAAPISVPIGDGIEGAPHLS